MRNPIFSILLRLPKPGSDNWLKLQKGILGRQAERKDEAKRKRKAKLERQRRAAVKLGRKLGLAYTRKAKTPPRPLGWRAQDDLVLAMQPGEWYAIRDLARIMQMPRKWVQPAATAARMSGTIEWARNQAPVAGEADKWLYGLSPYGEEQRRALAAFREALR